MVVSDWQGISHHVAGSGHVEQGIPCQDRADAWTSPRPALMVLDGRGSAGMSQVGAAAAQFLIRKSLAAREDHCAECLDVPGHNLAMLGWHGLCLRMYHAAATEQLKVAEYFHVPASECEFTMTLAVIGAEHTGWMTVGDSPLVAIRHGIAAVIPRAESTEFANQTTFVSANPGTRLGLQTGILPSQGLDGLVAMSDGTASLLIDLAKQTPAPAISQILDQLRSGKWNASDVEQMLEGPVWSRSTRDDRSLAMLFPRQVNPRGNYRSPRSARSTTRQSKKRVQARVSSARNLASSKS